MKERCHLLVIKPRFKPQMIAEAHIIGIQNPQASTHDSFLLLLQGGLASLTSLWASLRKWQHQQNQLESPVYPVKATEMIREWMPRDCIWLQRGPGLVNLIAAIAYHLALPAAFTQPGDRILAEPCRSLLNKRRASGLVKFVPVVTYQPLLPQIASTILTNWSPPLRGSRNHPQMSYRTVKTTTQIRQFNLGSDFSLKYF